MKAKRERQVVETEETAETSNKYLRAKDKKYELVPCHSSEVVFVTTGYIDQAPLLQGRAKKLDSLFRSSPIEAYKAYVNTLPVEQRAFAKYGLFGTEPAYRLEANRIADGRKPYIADHLEVMDEINSRLKL